MKKITVRQMVTAAILAALSLALDLVSVKTGQTKFTIYGLPLLVAGIFCGPLVGTLAGFVEGFISQVIQYGITPTTAIWMLAPICWGGISGLIFWLFKKYRGKPISLIVTIVFTSLFVTGVNTGALLLDGLIYNYSTKFVILQLAMRFIVSFGFAVMYTILIVLIYPRLNKTIRYNPSLDDIDNSKVNEEETHS